MINVLFDCFYSAVFIPVALSRILVKSYNNPDYLIRLNERLAFYSENPAGMLKSKPIWIHTVSVGEFLAAKSLIDNLLESKKDVSIIITTTTPTSSSLVQQYIKSNKYHKKNLAHVYYPYDVGFICRRFLKTIKPCLAIFFETEIWPRMFREVKKTNIKLLILNARLSKKSEQGYSKIKKIITRSLNQVDFIAAQSEQDAQRFKNLGFTNNLHVLGNIKYDLKLPKDIDKRSHYFKNLLAPDKLVLIAASTHKGEDEIIVSIFKRLKKYFPELVLIIVPRHPERFDEVYNICISQDCKVLKYTDLKDLANSDSPEDLDNKRTLPTVDNQNMDVFLLDTLGHLLYFYKFSDLALIGGSLKPIGGHNPLEPALLKVPCIIGKYYENFATVVNTMSNEQAICITQNTQQLYNSIKKLLADRQQRLTLADAGYQHVIKHQGIINHYRELIDSMLAKEEVLNYATN